MELVAYKYTWCDFLTLCPYGKNCWVGDYDCSICEYHKFNHQDKTFVKDSTDYERYSIEFSGYIGCGYDEKIKEFENFVKTNLNNQNENITF